MKRQRTLVEEIYFDNSSTTKVCKKAVDKVVELMSKRYYNSDSLYYNGYKTKCEVEAARKIIADEINCKKDEIYFTSGGTEGNNLAVLGAAIAMKKQGNKIITSTVEHPSVSECMKELENLGFNVVYVPVDKNAKINEQNIYEAIDDDVVLVSIMTVNNEVGSIQDIQKIGRILKAKKSKALLHTDAVQAFGKIKLDVNKLCVDLMTISGHKVHAPKGVGALYIKKGTKIRPQTFGGGQENNIRCGTIATELVAGFGAAVENFGEIKDKIKVVENLNQYAKNKLLEIPCININSPEDALPNIINFSLGKTKSETMLHFLEEKSIMVSSGSTCSKGKKSKVLQAMGLSDERIDSAIRLSFCSENTTQEIDIFIQALKEGLNRILVK